LRVGLRAAYLAAVVSLLTVMPHGQASVALLLFMAGALGAAALMLRSETAQSVPVVTTISSDMKSLALLRRTVPELRMRRPAETIEAQVRWREAVRVHRQRRDRGGLHSP
jgi:hypothetical protein